MKIFKEEQRFTQLWLIVLIVVSLIVPIALMISEYTKPNSSLTLSDLYIFIALMLASSGLIFVFKLFTRIDEKGIHYRFFPFHRKMKLIKWTEITNAYIRTYDPIGDYGGWGLKGGWSKSKGKAINVSGDIGIQLELSNGKKLLIGTQKKGDAESVLENYKTKINA